MEKEKLKFQPGGILIWLFPAYVFFCWLWNFNLENLMKAQREGGFFYVGVKSKYTLDRVCVGKISLNFRRRFI